MHRYTHRFGINAVQNCTRSTRQPSIQVLLLRAIMSFNQGAVLFHGTAAAIMAYGYNSLSSLVMHERIQTQKGGHFQFLTILVIPASVLMPQDIRN